MKKISILFLVLALALTGCGYRLEVGPQSTTPTAEPTQEATTTATTPSTETVTNTPTPTATPLTPTPTAEPAANPKVYPLAGQTYSAWINGSPDTTGKYNVVWTASGWLWQPNLPPVGQRVGFVVSITIEEGVYTFNGVSCRLHLDTVRNGTGANNPQTVGYGNNLEFEVDTADGGQAWAFVACDPTDVTGFSIQWLGPLP